MLEEHEGHGRVVRDILEDVRGCVVGEDLDPVFAGHGAQFGPGHESFRAGRTQADEGADLGAELDGLILGQVADAHHVHYAFGVLVERKRVDDPDRVALAQSFEFV